MSADGAGASRGRIRSPTWPCPDCGERVWLEGFADATTVRGQGQTRTVHHCGVCELTVVRRR